ncbi:MAG: M23 family metallopeptidase [Thiomargarita sp.]|nr:M23 family metallopeptidase [Thiomargarita sp.]
MNIIIVQNKRKGFNFYNYLIFVPLILTLMLTIATVGYSKYIDNNQYLQDYNLSSQSSFLQNKTNNFEQDVELHISNFQIKADELNKQAQELVLITNQLKTHTDFSWKSIIKQQHISKLELFEQPKKITKILLPAIVKSQKNINSPVTSQVKTSKKINFSLSWHKAPTKKQAIVASKKTRFSAYIPSPIEKLKKSFQLVSKSLFKPYRSRVKALPAGWPMKKGRISSKFGWRGKRMHKGIDIAARKGTAIFAVEDGVVLRAKYVRGYGNLVEIKHSETYSTRYAHNSKNLVKLGNEIKKGQVIAYVGSTGRSTGAHLHFEVRENGAAINPIKYLGVVQDFMLTQEDIKLTEYVKLTKK